MGKQVPTRIAWKRVANDWSDIKFSIYHNSIDFDDAEQAVTVGDVLYYQGANEDGESLDRLLNGDGAVLTPETHA